MRDDFGVIVISHGDENFSTIDVLRDSGYTGKAYIVVDDEDSRLEEYKSKYGDLCHVFHKTEWFDCFDNCGGPNTTCTFARNECFSLAKEKKLRYFFLTDDDLKSLSFRYEKDGHLVGKPVKNADALFEAICQWFDDTNLSCMGFSNPADYIGGKPQDGKRNVMNGFFLKSEDDFVWRSRTYQDVIAAITESRKGRVWLKTSLVQNVYDVWTEKNKSKKRSGTVPVYEKYGFYHMRFYLVMAYPDCSFIKANQDYLDGSVKNVNAYPYIISEAYRK